MTVNNGGITVCAQRQQQQQYKGAYTVIGFKDTAFTHLSV